jgi:long-chain acyl-CoA synthetase
MKNLKEIQPTKMLCVPLLIETMYNKMWANIRKKGIEDKVNTIIKLTDAIRPESARMAAKRKVFAEIHESLGGRLDLMVSGGAPVDPDVLRGLRDFGFRVIQGYGLTECAPLISANYPKENKFGSVGKPVSYMDVKIENEEILVKGPGVMLGYYKNEEATKEAFTEDGYLHTGDLGYFDEEGYLYITGRSKNLIILDNGKNIYPEELEVKIATIEGVKDVMVYDGNGKICAAIQPTDINSKEITQGIRQAVKELNASLPSYKKIVALDFIGRDFPKTTTMKIKRKEAIKLVVARGINITHPHHHAHTLGNSATEQLCLSLLKL